MVLNKVTETAIMPSFTNNVMMTDFLNCRCVYYDSDKKKGEDMSTLFAYERAQFAVSLFVRGLLFNELIDNKTDTAEAVLYMPTKDITVSVSCEGMISPIDRCLDNQAVGRVRTNIGEFSTYTYKRILSIPYSQNPIKQFCAHLDEVYGKVRQMLEERNARFDADSIDTSELMKYNICDVLNVHRFALVSGVASSFEVPVTEQSELDSTDEYPLF